MKFLVVAILVSCTCTIFGQNLSKEIDSIYSFKPSKLSVKEQESKLPALDKFWNKVKSDTTEHLPKLRFELDQPGHNPFFYYDGSGLLLSLSDARIDKELAVRAILKCDLDDINRELYVSTINKLAREDIAVTPAAVRILHDDKFSFFVPQHVMTFNHGYCLAYMLLPQNSLSYIDTLISMFPSVGTTSRKSIITTLWFAYSCQGDEFINTIASDKAIEKDVREYARKIKGYKKLTRDQEEYLQVIGKEHLGRMREMSLQRFSDEAIEQLDMTTRVMRMEQACH